MFSLKNESKNMKIAIGVILGLFFTITVCSIFYYGDSTLLGNFKEYNNDDVKYVRSAEVLLDKGMFVYKSVEQPTVFIMPGLPYAIAFFIKLFGSVNGLVAFKIFQGLTQTFCLLLVFLIGRKVFKNSKVGLIAMALSLFYFADIWSAHLFLTECLFRVLFLTMFYVAMFAIEEKRTKYYIIAGICFGLSLLFRPPVGLFPIVILIMWIKEKYSFKEMAKYTGVVALITVIIMSPWWIRNYKQFDRFIPFTLSTGNPMLLGTYINYDYINDPIKGTSYDSHRIENLERQTKPGMSKEIITNFREDDKARNRIEGLLKESPLKTIQWYLVGKTSKLFITPFYWFAPFRVFTYMYHSILMGLSVIGLIAYFRKRNKFSNFMMFTVLYFVIVTIPFVCFSRYYYPLMSFSIITAAFGIYTLFSYFNKKHKLLN